MNVDVCDIACNMDTALRLRRSILSWDSISARNERKSRIVAPKSVKSVSKSSWFLTNCSALINFKRLLTNGNKTIHRAKTAQRVQCGACDWVDLTARSFNREIK